MTYTDFAAEVNRLHRENSDRLNKEFAEGKRLFGASYQDLPDAVIRIYFIGGVSPKMALASIYAERR